MFKLELEYHCPSWNILYSGVHWSKRKKQVDEIHQLVYYSALNKIKKPFDHPVVMDIEVHYKDKRRHDPDNVCIKMFVDGLVMAKVLVDDDSKHIEELLVKVKTGEKKDKIIMTII